MSVKPLQNGKIPGTSSATASAVNSGRVAEQVTTTSFQLKDPPKPQAYSKYWVRKNDQYKSFKEEMYKIDGFPSPPEIQKKFGPGEWIITPLDQDEKEVKSDARLIVIEGSIGTVAGAEMSIPLKTIPTQPQQMSQLPPPPPPPSELASVLLESRIASEAEEKRRARENEEEAKRRQRAEQDRLEQEKIANDKRISLEEAKLNAQIEANKQTELARVRIEQERIEREEKRRIEREERLELEKAERERRSQEKAEKIEEEERKHRRELELKASEERAKLAEKEEKDRKERAEREARREELEATIRREKAEREEKDRKDRVDKEDRERKDRQDREDRERKEKAEREEREAKERREKEDREARERREREDREARDRKERIEAENQRAEREEKARKDAMELEQRRLEREDKERKERIDAEERRIAREKEDSKQRTEFIMSLVTPAIAFASSTIAPIIVEKLKDSPKPPPPPPMQDSRSDYVIEKLRDIESKVDRTSEDSYRRSRHDEYDDDDDENSNRSQPNDSQSAIEEKLSWMRLGQAQGGVKKDDSLMGKFEKYIPMMLGAVANKQPQQQKPKPQQAQQAQQERPALTQEIDKEALERMIAQREQAAYEHGLREQMAATQEFRQERENDGTQNHQEIQDSEDPQIPRSQVGQIVEKVISDTFSDSDKIFEILQSDPARYGPALKRLVTERGMELMALQEAMEPPQQEYQDPQITEEEQNLENAIAEAGEDIFQPG